MHIHRPILERSSQTANQYLSFLSMVNLANAANRDTSINISSDAKLHLPVSLFHSWLIGWLCKLSPVDNAQNRKRQLGILHFVYR